MYEDPPVFIEFGVPWGDVYEAPAAPGIASPLSFCGKGLFLDSFRAVVEEVGVP